MSAAFASPADVSIIGRHRMSSSVRGGMIPASTPGRLNPVLRVPRGGRWQARAISAAVAADSTAGTITPWAPASRANWISDRECPAVRTRAGSPSRSSARTCPAIRSERSAPCWVSRPTQSRSRPDRHSVPSGPSTVSQMPRSPVPDRARARRDGAGAPAGAGGRSTGPLVGGRPTESLLTARSSVASPQLGGSSRPDSSSSSASSLVRCTAPSACSGGP